MAGLAWPSSLVELAGPRTHRESFHAQIFGGEGEIRTHGTLVQRFSNAHRGGRAGPSAFDLSVKAFDLAPRRPPLFAGEGASEAAASRWSESGSPSDAMSAGG